MKKQRTVRDFGDAPGERSKKSNPEPKSSQTRGTTDQDIWETTSRPWGTVGNWERETAQTFIKKWGGKKTRPGGHGRKLKTGPGPSRVLNPGESGTSKGTFP